MNDIGCGKRLNAREWTEARKMYLAGHTYEQIGEKYGIHRDTVYRRATKEGWTKKDIMELRQEAVDRSQQISVEKTANKIAELNAEMLAIGDGLLNIVKVKLNQHIADINAGNKVDMTEYKKLIDSFHTLMHDMRLQTGQTTSNNKTDVNGNVNNTEQIIYLPERDEDPADIEKRIQEGEYSE